MKFIQKPMPFISEKLLNDISKEFNIATDVVKLLFLRGLSSREDVQKFLQPSEEMFYNPLLLSNMDKVVKRLKKVIADKENIIIIGDYDTDGICATAILVKYFQEQGVKAQFYLPNRFTDGYGITYDLIDKIKENYNGSLIITVDCGISCYKEIEYAKKQGFEIVVTDHHEVPEIVPDCLIVNPKLKNQKYPFNNLCGAGVALKLVQALGGVDSLKKYLSIAALATVADIVPLIDENRAIVSLGLSLCNTLPLGIKKLIKSLKIESLTSSDIAYKVAPKLNTAGRLGDAAISLSLFLETSERQISKVLDKLEQLNVERISYCNRIYEEAVEIVESENLVKNPAIILYKEDWENGVLGIICARLVEKYYKPVCLFSKNNGELKGSIRSIEGIDIYKALTHCCQVLIRYGGHCQAGGLSISENNLKKFIQEFNNYLKATYSDDIYIQTKYYDLEANETTTSLTFIKQLQLLEPFGFANERPMFLVNLNGCKIEKMRNHNNHLTIKNKTCDLIGFNHEQYLNALNTNCSKFAIADFYCDVYNKKERVKAIIKHYKFSHLNGSPKQDLINFSYLTQLSFLKETKAPYKEFDLNNLDKLLDNNNFGTLIVANSFENYSWFISKKLKNFNSYEVFTINNKTGENTVVFAPSSYNEFSRYSKIIFLDKPLCDGFISFKNSNIYVSNNNGFDCKILNVSRDSFGLYHNAIVNTLQKSNDAQDLFNFYNNLKKFNPNLIKPTFAQFYFVLLVEIELGIFYKQDCLLYLNNKISTKLKSSNIYNYISLKQVEHDNHKL